MAIKDLLIKLRLKGAKNAQRGLGGVDKSMQSLAKQAVVAAGGFIALKKAFSFTVELKNFARDAEETTNKFKTVFSSMATVATKTAKTLADSFGIAHTTAMELLGDTGDILVGFGFTEKSALELSQKVNELSIDLASFTNFAGGASGASKALTKAILGETESAKALGIVLRQGTKEFKDSVKVLQESEGMTYNQAMATTLLNDAYKQSTKAIGDFARTQDDLANQERILAERFKALKEELGGELTPVFQELTSTAMDFIETINIGKMQDVARSITGITVAFTAYNAAALLAKVRTIQFQATLVKTGWGAVIVGAGLAIGKMLELAGVFSTAEGELDGLNLQMKELNERSFLQLGGTEQKEKIIETKKELMGMFEEGTKGSKVFQSFLNSVSLAINKQGLTASEAESLYTAAVQSGVAVRKSAMADQTTEYDKYIEKQREGVAQSEKELAFIEKLKIEYPELAKKMGLLNEVGKKQVEITKEQAIQMGIQSDTALGALRNLIKAKFATMIAGMLETEIGTKGFAGLATGAVGAALAMGLFEKLVPKFAQGGQFITDSPQMIMVGDNPGGRERVTVEPLSSPGFEGGGITVNIMGGIVQDDYVRNELIPAINKAKALA